MRPFNAFRLLALAACLQTLPDSCLAATASPAAPTAAQIHIDGQQFEYVGAFIPGWYWGQRVSDQTDAQLVQSARSAGFRVLHVMLPSIVERFGVYSESEFHKLDNLLAQASADGMRVVILFIHNIGMTQTGFGPFYSPFGIETLIKDPDFKSAFVDYMKAMVNRVNSVSGVRYADDPTILGWEIIMEPISGDHNYPVRPPNVTHSEVRQWLDEMARELKAVDSNHLVGVSLSAAGEGDPELDDMNQSVLETPSLDFIEIEDGDVRVLQTERSNRYYDLALATGKPVILFVSLTGLSYPDPGETVPNETRVAEACNDLLWQADTLLSEFSAYLGKGAAGFSFFSWRVPGFQAPDFDACFSYSLDTAPVVRSFLQMNELLGPLNVAGPGFATTGYGLFASRSDCLFDWAERTYSDFFAPVPGSPATLAPYYYRHYPRSGAYLGTSTKNDHVYYLGPAFGDELFDLGDMSSWLVTAGCP